MTNIAGAEDELTFDREKLFAARLLAVGARPYLAAALFALHPVASRRVPTMAVDAYWRCYVSPAFVRRMPIEELASVWVHEVSHLLRDHHGRGDAVAAAQERTSPRERTSPGERTNPGEPTSPGKQTGPGHQTGPGDRLRMNIAADLKINDDSYGEGLVRPEGAVQPAALRLPEGLLMEEYLTRFRLGALTQDWVWLDCGSGADGAAREWDLGPDGANGLTTHERDAVRFRVAHALRGHPGHVPQGWRRWAEDAFHPPQPWRELLGGAIRAAASASGAGDDYSYRRPARRSASLPGVVQPSLRRQPPNVSVVIDTSGSVSDRELGSALLEVAAIARTLGGRRDLVRVVSCDAAAQLAGSLCRAEGLTLIGGGGTDLRAGFAAALRSRPRPDVIVVLTDGQTPWPPDRPSCRTVVGLFDRAASCDHDEHAYMADRPPEWARVVTIG